MPTIAPCLWFDDQAEEALAFYRSVFADSKGGPRLITGEGPSRNVLTASCEIEGLPLIGLNGGPHFQFTEAVSFLVACADQAEVDDLWDKLCAGGAPSRCGWLKDRYGLSWQIVPAELFDLMDESDPVRAGRVHRAVMGMVKLDLAALKAAHAG